MPIYIDPTGESTYGIGLCARCSRKFPLAQLRPDPNSPGLMVCDDDADEFDPYRLPARQTENITLPFTRPDLPLTGRRAVVATPVETFRMLTEGGDVMITEGGDAMELEEAP